MNWRNNYPPGCTDKDVSPPDNTCQTCDGEGTIDLSNCCGANIIPDVDICSNCKDHCDKCVCEDCKGKGWVEGD